MAPKAKILIWGFIIAGLVLMENGESLDIQDGTVLTEREKTLIRGSLGILTCRFTGSPYAVFWKKGHDIWKSPTLIQWTPEDKTTGPRYDDGSCNMDENYSLIIKSVNYTDRGRFICLVSNEEGILVDNYTDVTVYNDALEMESSVTLSAGQTGIIHCQVNIRPRKVSWVGSKNESLVLIDIFSDFILRGGPGYRDGLFNITNEYSLKIYNVKIQHEGLYFCLVTDYDTGIIYKGQTVLTVIAHPMAPFPAIHGCLATEDHGNCIFNVDSPVEITCHANRYYPDIGLYFKLGMETVTNLVTQTWNNSDGTKNKSVTTIGHKSNDVYICVAVDIPGIDGNRSTSVRLIRQVGSINPAAFIVPIILIGIGLLTWGILYIAGKVIFTAKTHKEDTLSCVELWKLVELVYEQNEIIRLTRVIQALCGYKVGTRFENWTKECYYRELCKWKCNCATNIQKWTFYDNVYAKGLEKSLADLKEFRGRVSTKVSLVDFEHILREIAERENIEQFLESLGIDPPACMINENTSSGTFFQKAMEKLDQWTKWNRDINPLVILSSTLEKMNQKSANNFFLVPDEKKEQSLQVMEIKEYTRKCTRNHWDKLAKYIPHDKTGKNFQRENNVVLFNTEKMLHDWWNMQECSHYRRRCKLDVAIILPAKLLGDTKHLSPKSCTENQQIKLTESELQLIADNLNANGKRQVCKHLGLSNISGSADDEELYDALLDWRMARKGEISTMHGELISALKLQYTSANDQWPSDDELKLIAHYIDHKYTTHVREHLELTNVSRSGNMNDLFDYLCAWRQSMKEDCTNMYRKLHSALKDTNVSGLLSPLRRDCVHKAEYVQRAFNLLMIDILPVAKHLVIRETELLSCKPPFTPANLSRGTIGLVSTLITSMDKNKQREYLCRRLKESGFPSSIEMKIISHQMSYGELWAIFTSPTICMTSADEEKEAPQQEPQEEDHLLAQEEIQAPDTTTAPVKPKVTKAAESTKGFSRIKNILPYISSYQSPDTTQQERKPKKGDALRGISAAETSSETVIPMEPAGVQVAKASPDVKERATSSIETTFPIEPCVRTTEVSRHLNEIMKTLNLSDEDVSSSMDDNPDEFTLFKLWKEKISFSVVSERSSVIKCLQDSGKCELARSVIEGKFVPEEINLSFVKHIVKKAKASSQLKELAEAFGMEKGFKESQRSVDAISETIWNRLLFTRKGSKNTPEDGSIATKMSNVVKDVKSQMVQSQIHKLVNQADKLVECGFLDLARELLVIYQQ